MSAPTLRDQPTAPEPSAPSATPDVRAEVDLIEHAVKREPPASLTWSERFEVYVARLSTRNRFWHKVCALIWLPYAFKSGIKMKRVDERTFSATLPFKRFNRNWYNAMAGAALLANSEIAAGAYVFGATGGSYTIVCKHLSYNFLRPCYGPALYHIVPREDINELLATGKEFNITLDMEIIQQALVPAALARLKKKDPLMARICAKDRKVGQCVATFHVTPVLHQKAKRGDTRRVG